MAAQIKGRLRHGYCAQTFGCAVIMGGRVRRIGGAQWRWEVFGPLARRRRPCRARGVEQEADRRRGDAAPRSGAACVVPGGRRRRSCRAGGRYQKADRRCGEAAARSVVGLAAVGAESVPAHAFARPPVPMRRRAGERVAQGGAAGRLPPRAGTSMTAQTGIGRHQTADAPVHPNQLHTAGRRDRGDMTPTSVLWRFLPGE